MIEPFRRHGVLRSAVPACAVAALVASAACSKKPSGQATAGSAAPSVSAPFKPPAPIATGLPGGEKAVSEAVNPNNEREYVGPTGTVRGRIVTKGDPPPDVPGALSRITDACAKARPEYGKLFRVGPDGGLGDVFVGVTGYKGYVPAKSPDVKLSARDCFWGTRTIGVTFGQNLAIVSKDREAYIPELLGAQGQPQIVATPGANVAAVLYAPSPGRYVLIDNLKLFMTADVLVVKFPTHDVTNIDGAFEISGIPVGKVQLSALLPITGGGVNQEVEVTSEKPVEVELVIPFDQADYDRKRAAAAASASANAASIPSSKGATGAPSATLPPSVPH